MPDLGLGPDPSETALVFGPDDTALCLLRRDPDTGLLGKARPPYAHWDWSDTGLRIGGPVTLRLPDGRLIAAARLYDGQVRKSLCWVDAGPGRLDECRPCRLVAIPATRGWSGATGYCG